eukprot:EG_transcript_1506
MFETTFEQKLSMAAVDVAGPGEGPAPVGTPLALPPPDPASPLSVIVGPAPWGEKLEDRPPGGDALTTENMDMLHEEVYEAEQRDGMEMLRSVFDSMAVNGKVTMDQLPFVLVGAEVQATTREIEEAIEEFLPDADDPDALLDLDHVIVLYQQLTHNANLAQMENVPVQVVAVSRPPVWRRLTEWAKRRYRQRKAKQTAYEKHMKPTMRLLLLVLAASCAISVAVVVFAVVFIFSQSNGLVVDHIKRDGQLMMDGLRLFGYTHPVESYAQKLGRLAMLTGVVVERLGHQNTKRTLLASLQYQQLLLSNLLDGWYEHDSFHTVNASVMVAKGWLDQLARANASVADIVRLVDRINPRMPDGHEILLARWNRTTQRIDFLTAFRFAALCDGVCGADQVNGSTATKRALAGESGALFGYDYRPKPVVAGYTPLPALGLALVYNLRQSANRADFMAPAAEAIDVINAASAARATSNDTWRRENSQEIVLADQEAGPTTILTTSRVCDAQCLAVANVEASPVALALRGVTGTNETADLNGEPVLCAYGPLPLSGLGMEVKVAVEEFEDGLFSSLGDSLDFLNQQLAAAGPLVVEFVSRAKPNASSAVAGLQFQTAWRFPDECDGPCGAYPGSLQYLHAALDQGLTGVSDGLDYRGRPVTAGVYKLPELAAALAIEVETSQILKDGTQMAATIATFENDVRFAGKSTEVAIGRKKPGVAVAHSARDYDRITVLKHRQDCPNLTCTGPSTHMVLAVNGHTGYARGPDYRNVDVMGAYTYLPSLDIGLTVKIDAAEAEERSYSLTAVLSGCSVVAVAVSMAVLALLANVLLRSMDRAWEEGKRAVEREKQAFRAVIEAMYPAQVAQRMLVGESQIVYHVPGATVFFSDVYEFTTTSNSVSPKELIQFLGYTFGVMDAVAEHHHVHKVKTIGDAYLAVSGLPGLDPRTGNAALDMLLFASDCNQLFSNRFLHPAEGDVLDFVVQTVLAKKVLGKAADMPAISRLARIPKRPSQIAYGAPPPDMAGIVDECGVPPVHCIMRYGLAAGPLTAGVLQGKTPLFDIWGKTVNLASRMEST